MTEGFEADDRQCFELFGGEKALYEVPSYQRPYSWEEKHVKQLMQDLTDAYRHSTSPPGEKGTSTLRGGGSSYYLGSIILVGEDRTRDSRLEILDGQQRITTLTILYAVLNHHYGVKPSNIEQDTVSVRLKDRTRGQWRLKTRENADFQQTVLETLDLEADNRYAASAGYIVEFLEQEFDDTDGLDGFLNYVDDQVNMVRIRTSNVQEAVRIFQTVNTRGKDLTLSDKIKSYLLSYVEEDAEDDFVEVWREIINKLDGDYGKLDSILSWYRFYLTEAEVDTSSYGDLTAKLDETNPIKEIRKIRDFVDEYLASQRDADKWTFMLDNHGQQRYWQTILIAARLNGVEDLAQLKRCLVQLYYSFMIGGHSRSKTKVPSRAILKRVKNGEGVESVEEYLDDKRHRNRIASKVRNNLTTENVFNESWHKNLLIAIEYHLSTERKVEKIAKGSELHIEHVLPKGWDSETIDHDYWSRQFSEEEAESLKHTIGNLIPLQYDLNQSVGLRPFPTKVEIYRGNGDYPKSSFDLVDAVADGRYTDWSPTEIRKHRDYMIEQTAELLGFPEDELISDD